MSAYSAQLFAGVVPSGQTTLYTATSTYVTVVRDIEVSNQSGGSINIGVWLAVSGLAIYLVLNPTMANATRIQWEGRCVMETGQELVVYSSSASNVGVAISGYQLVP